MKTATMPALRVHPELRQTAEEILRRSVELRRAQQAFIERFSCRMVDSAEASPFLELNGIAFHFSSSPRLA